MDSREPFQITSMMTTSVAYASRNGRKALRPVTDYSDAMGQGAFADQRQGLRVPGVDLQPGQVERLHRPGDRQVALGLEVIVDIEMQAHVGAGASRNAASRPFTD